MVSLPRRIATFTSYTAHGLLVRVCKACNCTTIPYITSVEQQKVCKGTKNTNNTKFWRNYGGGWVASLIICTREKLVFFSTGGSLLAPGFPASSGSPAEILIRILRGEPHRGARGKAGSRQFKAELVVPCFPLASLLSPWLLCVAPLLGSLLGS